MLRGTPPRFARFEPQTADDGPFLLQTSKKSFFVGDAFSQAMVVIYFKRLRLDIGYRRVLIGNAQVHIHIMAKFC